MTVDVEMLSDAKIANMLSDGEADDAVRMEAAHRLFANACAVHENPVNDADSLEREAQAIQFCKIVQDLGTRPDASLWFTTPDTVKERYRAQAKAARRARAHAAKRPRE